MILAHKEKMNFLFQSFAIKLQLMVYASKY